MASCGMQLRKCNSCLMSMIQWSLERAKWYLARVDWKGTVLQQGRRTHICAKRFRDMWRIFVCICGETNVMESRNVANWILVCFSWRTKSSFWTTYCGVTKRKGIRLEICRSLYVSNRGTPIYDMFLWPNLCWFSAEKVLSSSFSLLIQITLKAAESRAAHIHSWDCLRVDGRAKRSFSFDKLQSCP